MLDLDSLQDFKYRHLLFWDSEKQPPQGDWDIVLWGNYKTHQDISCISLPELVEAHADELKSRFLAWIYELGETVVGSKNIVDHLALYPGFSFWWMTLLAEKSYSKSSCLYDAVRLFLVEDLIRLSQAQQVSFFSADHTMTGTIVELCNQLNISCHVNQHDVHAHKPMSLSRWIYSHSPYPIQAIISLCKQLWQMWSFRAQVKPPSLPFAAEVSFFDYFIHMDREALAQGHFASNFWTVLPSHLIKNNIASHWIHRYVPHDAIPKSVNAVDRMTQFNQQNLGKAKHQGIEAVIDWKLILHALKDYSRLVWQSVLLRSMRHRFKPSNSQLNLWRLFTNDWLTSLRGPVAMMNCLNFHLIQKTLQDLPIQKLGFYLQENQGWEMALIYAWRAVGHGQLIGVAHSTVRYWDFRYFYDPKTYLRSKQNALPMPDKVALNGQVAWNLYQAGGYPVQDLIQVEALRYLYLLDCPINKIDNNSLSTYVIPSKARDLLNNSSMYTAGDPSSQAPRDDERLGTTLQASSVTNVLICGDIQTSLNHQMLSWLESISAGTLRYIVKPHPACMIAVSDYPRLSMEMKQESLGVLFQECDVVMTSNNTSAAVEAHQLGLPVIQVLDGHQFNLSPLRGNDSVFFVKSASELKEVFMTSFISHSNPVTYFYLDSTISRWRELLNFKDNKDVEVSRSLVEYLNNGEC